ncbi:MAG: T9SS type A sorting domain-containing protein [Bacteroidales bacterium]|nr:T9SS type A sorting domain-containing protein [Bacteroidales bacterium]
MKKILILTLLVSFGLFSMAQTKFQVKNNLKEEKSTNVRSSDQVMNDPSIHPYLKPMNHSNNGTDDISVIDIGGAGNAWGLCSGARTYMWVENDINSIAFSHRMLAPPGGPGTGYIAYDFSIDGGATWEINNQVYEAPTALENGRYPQCVIYNPEGNTDPANAFFSYYIPVLDQSNGATWGGEAWGGNFLTTIPPVPTQTNISSRPSEGIYMAVPDALHITPNGNTFVVEPSIVDGTFTGYTGELIFSNGVFNDETNDYEYTQTLFEAPITDDPIDCTVASQRIAFSPDGQIGYVGLLTNNGENTEESYGCYYPVLYKSTDGGENWDDEPINVQLGGPDGLEAVLNFMSDETLAQIYEPPIPPRDEIPFTTAFNLDLVVDAYGNPHIITVVGIGSQAWSIYSAATGEPCNGWIAMLHIYSTDDETWMADTLYTPNTFRGEFAGNNVMTEDTRPQISITPDGKKLFFSWIDSDQPETVDNIYPDIFCVGYDIDHDVYTEEDGNYKLWNVTTLTAAWMSAYMATQSYYVFDNGDSWEIPFVYQEMDINNNLEPVQYKYIKGFVIEDDDFPIISDEQTVDVEPGFQFVSSYICPDSPDMTDVVAEIMNDDLQYVRNSTGAMLRKIGPNWVNGIGDWVGTEGYLIKTSAIGEFTLTGSIIPSNTPIPLFAGFQFVSYLPETEIDALVAFATIIGDNLLYVRNSEGAMLRKIGPNWVNGIGNCIPTEGYLIKMAADDELLYTLGGKSSSLAQAIPSHLIFEGGNAAEAVYTIYVDGLEIGDEVAAFNGDIVLGSMKVNSNNVFDNDLPIFSQLDNGQGYVSGEPITLKVWSDNNVITTEFEMESVYNSYVSNVYPENDGEFSIVKISKGATLAEELLVYPNPANDVINISSNFEVSNVKVMNYLGQTIDNINVSGMDVTINTLTYDAGIYFIQVETEKGITTQKIIIE